MAGALLLPTTSHAQEGKATRAEQLFEEGKALLRQKQVEPACEKLRESQQVEPAVGTLGLLAYCRELQGRTATAWRRYLESAEMARAANDKERERVARERAAALEAKLSRVRFEVESEVPGLVVTVDGHAVTRADWTQGVPTDPGRVDVGARAPGHSPWVVRLDLGGDAASLTIRIPALEPTKEEAAPSPPVSAPREAAPNLIPGLVVGGAGAVFLGVGSYFGLRAMSKNDDSKAHCVDNACDPTGGELRDDAKRAATVSTATIGLGLIGVGVGAAMLVSALGEEPHSERGSGVHIAPALGPEHAGIGLRGVF